MATSNSQLEVAFVFVVALSLKIFELQCKCPCAIIDIREEKTMQTNDLYVQQLENVIINRLLPVYRLYYEQKGEFPPELDLEVIKRMHRQEPALFKRWPLATNKQGF